MKKITQLFIAVFSLVLTTSAIAQSTVSGTVIDSDINAPLPGANVVEKGTTNGTTSDFDGNFSLKTQSDSGELVITYVGYAPITVAFSGNQSLGNLVLNADNSLEEVVIVGTGVIDLAEGRKTPIAVSTIRANEIQQKIGTQDITMTLVNTPSIYVAGQAGGFGDSRISVRGFGQDNTAYLLNGQPINGMEDGKMYWSNWSGMNDVANAVQIQRGLGSSKLAISSVGGTVNFVTKTTDKRPGGFFFAGIANDDYFKTGLQYSSGKNSKGWGTSVMLSHWQGDGYNEGTFGQGQTYFVSVGYTPNDKHNFNFLITGAPQWHDQNFSKSISTYLKYGRKYNNNWGTYKGQYLTERRNFYHKPVANLNWDFNINETTNLSTVLYASWGRGGGTGGRGRRDRTSDGYVDYDAIYAKNAQVENGAGVYFGNNSYITRASMNLHDWYGLVSNLEKDLSENLKLNVGFDLRTYYGEHFRLVHDFHGLNSWKENIRLRDQNNNHQTYGSFGTYKFVETSEYTTTNPWDIVFNNYEQKDKIAYSNDERISYGGLFTQLEYSNDSFSAFFQGSISNQWHQRFDYYQYADNSLINGTSPQNALDDEGNPVALPEGITDGVDSEKVSNFGYNAKAGASYIINEDHKVYANVGYYSRQPYHDNIYLNFTNLVNPLTENEKILGVEAGYGFKSQFFSANLNLYRTSWKDRVVTSSKFVDDALQFETNQGVEQVHSGVEFDFTAKPLESLRLKGFVSVGNWEYKGKGITRTTDEEQNVLSTEEEDFDGGKVGDAAQFTAGIGADWKFARNLSIDSDFRFYDKLYANVGAVKENLELPSFNLVDVGFSYKLPVGKDKSNSVNFRLNVNNVFDTVYLSELRSAEFGYENQADFDAAKAAALASDENDQYPLQYESFADYQANGRYEGIDVRNQGYFGLGRTWNFGIRYKF